MKSTDHTILETILISALTSTLTVILLPLIKEKLSSVSKKNAKLNAIKRLHKSIPKLFNEMAHDVQNKENQFIREFILLRRGNVYGGKGVLCYYFEDHDSLNQIIALMKEEGLIEDITDNNVPKLRILPLLYQYLSKLNVKTSLLPKSPANVLYGDTD